MIKNRDLYHDNNQYWHTIRSELSISEDNSFQFAVMDGEEHSAQSVEIPGMDKAVFINLGMNTRHSLLILRGNFTRDCKVASFCLQCKTKLSADAAIYEGF